MKNSKTPRFLFRRSLLALSLGCALASLPLSVRAQEAEPASGDAPAATETAAAPEMAATPQATPKKSAPTEAKLSTSDKTHIQKFFNDNEKEVATAKLAEENAESQEVKDFAQKMIDHHSKANDELKDIAMVHNWTVGSDSKAPAKPAREKLSGLKGKSFDTAYLNQAVMDHETDVKEYAKAKKEIKNEKLLAYVDETLPLIEEHLKMAKEMKGDKAEAPEKSKKDGKKAKKS